MSQSSKHVPQDWDNWTNSGNKS